jgi:zinc and cadmium transporter
MSETPLFYASVLFLASMSGWGLFMLTRKQASRGVKVLLAFSASYLLGITLLHLFPELYHSDVPHIGWFVVAGFLLQVILDFFSHGVEHGHAHTHQHQGSRFLASVMISLWIHAFIEGMPFGGVVEMHAHDHAGHLHEGDHSMHDHRMSLLLGISLHKVTEALVFTALLVGMGMKLTKTLAWVALFALMAPLGAFAHYFVGVSGVADLATFTPMVTGVLIGILLHVSTIILFESDESHSFNWMKFAAILVGLAMAGFVS